MTTSAYQTEGMSMADMEEPNEPLEPVELPEHESVPEHESIPEHESVPEHESGHEMLLKLLELVESLHNVATPVPGGEGEVDLALQAANEIVPLVGKIREHFDEQMARITEQDATIVKLNGDLAEARLELQNAYMDMAVKKVESGSSQQPGQKEEEEEEEEEGLYAPNGAHLKAWVVDQAVYKENPKSITHDAFQYGHFVSNPASPTKAVTMAMPTADGLENIQSRLEKGAGNQPLPGSSGAGQSGQAIQRTSSEESLPHQAFDMTFPSGRGTFRRPGPVYERMPPPRIKLAQRISSGEDSSAEASKSGEGDMKGSVPLAENDSAYGFAAYIQGLQSTDPQPLWPASKFLRPRKYGKFIIFDILEWTLYTLFRAAWDLIPGQLIAWWHLLLFLITTVLYLFTGLLDPLDLPKVPVLIVPRLSWSILANQAMCLTYLMSFLACRRELDILLQANGLSRRYMLDYVYEESRMILFIGIDKGMFRWGTVEPENFWGSGNDTERFIGLTQ
ncbi:unnamed protein product [Clonostachys byssicola]|uniref:Uncharacterized protein n=1 Tax=Clonostachys byssicola TaxID=160290 RepID=A0A9N9UR57_9HYPO|nr:unnamed protein product [Clonostachys byssicola]